MPSPSDLLAASIRRQREVQAAISQAAAAPPPLGAAPPPGSEPGAATGTEPTEGRQGA